jgi:hypothetical protein
MGFGHLSVGTLMNTVSDPMSMPAAWGLVTGREGVAFGFLFLL